MNNNKEIEEIEEIKNFYNIDYNKEMDNDNKDNNETVLNLSNEEILKLKEMITSFKPKPKREVKYIIVEPKEPKPKKVKPEKPKKEPKPNRDENNKPLKFKCECGGVYTHLSKWCHNQSQKHKHYEEHGEILKKTCFNFTKKDLTPEELENRKEWYRNYTKTHKFPKKSNVCKNLIKNLEVNIPKEEDEILKNIINLINKDDNKTINETK